MLISIINNEPIGFFSWDPRKMPQVGEIGQNCIIPLHRSKGYGKMQIQKVIELFKIKSTRIVKVTTGEHPFFIPARKIYLSCGFTEVSRSYTRKFGGMELIHYEYKLV